MESTDNYDFSIFSPRNRHGRKNRNVILTMLVIWAVAVFGFQFLLRAIEKPTPERSLTVFESIWPAAQTVDIASVDYKELLRSLVLVKGKNTVRPEDQKVLSDAISFIAFSVFPDDVRTSMLSGIEDLKSSRAGLAKATDQEYLNLKTLISATDKALSVASESYTGFAYGSLEAEIFVSSLAAQYPESFGDESFAALPGIMKLYLTHNQSVLTDTKFLGFPFHYFYTAVFLLIMFIVLCLVYNILIEWRLEKEGIVE